MNARQAGEDGMTDKNDDIDRLSQQVRATVKKGSTDAKDASDASLAQLREAAEVAFKKIKAARAMARKKVD